MRRGIIISILFFILLSVSIVTYAEDLKQFSENTLKLNQQIIGTCRIGALEAVEIAKKHLKGHPLETHIERTVDNCPLFEVAILKEDPLSIVEVRIDAKTGEIIDIAGLSKEGSSTFDELSFPGKNVGFSYARLDIILHHGDYWWFYKILGILEGWVGYLCSIFYRCVHQYGQI